MGERGDEEGGSCKGARRALGLGQLCTFPASWGDNKWGTLWFSVLGICAMEDSEPGGRAMRGRSGGGKLGGLVGGRGAEGGGVVEALFVYWAGWLIVGGCSAGEEEGGLCGRLIGW